jgi:hypothetical protein
MLFCQLFPYGCEGLIKNNYEDFLKRQLKDFGKSLTKISFPIATGYLENELN